MIAAHVRRGGAYYRVCDPAWADPADTTYSKRHGGRWNPAGEFGALYLNASVAAAVANARRSLRLQFGDAVTFDDLQPHALPELAHFSVRSREFADAVTAEGLRHLELPVSYPEACERSRCARVARELYRAGEAGVAARCAPLPDEEELAIFDTHVRSARLLSREVFARWYPGLG